MGGYEPAQMAARGGRRRRAYFRGLVEHAVNLSSFDRVALLEAALHDNVTGGAGSVLGRWLSPLRRTHYKAVTFQHIGDATAFKHARNGSSGQWRNEFSSSLAVRARRHIADVVRVNDRLTMPGGTTCNQIMN